MGLPRREPSPPISHPHTHTHTHTHLLHEARLGSDPKGDLTVPFLLCGATQVKIQEELEEADGDHDKLHLWGRLRNEGVCKCGACDKRRHFTALRR